MLLTPNGLSPRELSAIAELERRVVAEDGGRLKLEWDSLRSRTPGLRSDVLWWDGDRLVGFAGVYAFGSMTPEIVGMVDPEARRRGIGSSLVTAALELCGERGRPDALLVVPRASAAGHALARRHGGQLDHSEYALALTSAPVTTRPDTTEDALPLTVRDAVEADIPLVERLLRSAFGFTTEIDPAYLVTPSARTLVVERSGEAVATLRLALSAHGEAGIYGFGVREDLRGQGIGAATLVRVSRDLQEAGVRRIALEVSVDNERALGLYTRIGFLPVTTEDYFRLRVSPDAAPPPG